MKLDSLVSLATRGPWALQVLAGAIAHFAANESTSTWPDAPPTVGLLAAAVARAGDQWGMARPSGRRYATEWTLVLNPDEPCPEVASHRSFVLARGEDGLGYAVTWTGSSDDAPAVHWVDFEDGSSRPVGNLESWCARVLLDSLFGGEDEGERDPDGLFFVDTVKPRLIEFLRMLSERRAELVASLEQQIAALEVTIERLEAEHGDAEAAYDQLAAASERRERLGRPPWPSVSAG